MPEHKRSVRPLDSEEAMNAALQAERRALDGIKACEQRAAELVDSARQQSRAIAQRTDRRITALHAWRTRALAEKVDAMLSEDGGQPDEVVQSELEGKTLEVAVERVAAQLTGDAAK